MNKELDFITDFHLSTKREYLKRMIDDKINSMKVARKFEKDFWDGERKYGYGGYKYIPNLQTPLAKRLIEYYKLTDSSHILDVGCGKGFLLYEIKKIIPNINVVGFDISKYAILNSKSEIRENLFNLKAQEKYPFKDNEFDLVISVNTLHNLIIQDLEKALNEIQRVGKKQYIVVESYRNISELFNLQCWALTAECFFSKEEWLWLFKKFGYKGEYELIYFN